MMPILKVAVICRGSSRSTLRHRISVAISAAVISLVVFGVAAVGDIVERRTAREDARRAIPMAAANARESVTFLWPEREDRWRDAKIATVSIGTSSGAALLPPGLPAAPAVGSMFASPALQALMSAEPAVAARFPYTLAGMIGSAGLVGPNELRAYVGRDRDPRAALVGGFGEANPLGTAAGVPWHRSASLILFALIPGLVVTWVSARLSSEQRDRMIGALRLVGLSKSQAALVGSIDTAAAAFAGIGGAVAVAVVGRWHVDRVSFAGMRVFPADVTLPVGRTIVLAVLLLASFLGIAFAAARSRLRDQRLRAFEPRGSLGLRDVVQVAPLFAAIAVAQFLAQRMRQQRASTFTELLPLVAVLGATAFVAVTPLTRLLGTLLHRSFRSRPTALLAGRKLVHDPDGFVRTGRYLALVVYVAVVGLVFVDQFTTDTSWATALKRQDGRQLLFVVPDPQIFGVVDRLSAVDGVQATMAIVSTENVPGQIVAASCEDLARIVERPSVAECGMPDVALRIGPSHGRQWPAFGTDQANVTVRIVDQPVSAAFGWTGISGLVATSQAAVWPGAQKSSPGNVYALVRDRDLEAVWGRIVAFDTQTHIYPSGADLVQWAPDPGRRWLVAGLAFAIGMTMLGLVTACVDRVPRLRTQAVILLRQGGNRRTTVISHLLGNGLSMVASAALGLVAGTTVARLYRVGLDRQPIVQLATSKALTLALVGAALITLITLPSVPRKQIGRPTVSAVFDA